MIIQLNPPIPVNVVGGKAGQQTWEGPTGTGMAIIFNNYGPDHNNTWTIIMDETGEIWDVENPFVRGQKNMTWGRTPKQQPHAS